MYASKHCGAGCVIRDATNEEGSMTEMREEEEERKRERGREGREEKRRKVVVGTKGDSFHFHGDQRFVAR